MKRRAIFALGAVSVMALALATSDMYGQSRFDSATNRLGDGESLTRATDAALQRHRLFQLAKSEFPVWYERLLEDSSRHAITGEPVDQSAVQTRKIAALLRLQQARFATKARPEKLDRLAHARLAFLRWLEKHNSAACDQFVRSRFSRETIFADLAGQNDYIAVLEKMASTELEAIIDSHKHQLHYATPTKNDYRLFYDRLAAEGWSRTEIQNISYVINSRAIPNELNCKDVRRLLETVVEIENQDTRSRLIVKLLTSSAISI